MLGSPTRGGSPGYWAITGTGAMCWTNCTPGMAGSTNACASGHPCPIVSIGMTFPTCVSSIQFACQMSAATSVPRPIPESVEPRLNFQQRLMWCRRWLCQDCCGTAQLPPTDWVSLECTLDRHGAFVRRAIGAASTASQSLAKPHVASK